MSFRNGPFTYMGRCGQVAARHVSGILVGAYELRLNGRVYRHDGVDLSSGRIAEGATPVSGSKKSEPFVHRSTLKVNAYGGGDQLGGTPVA